MAVTEWIPCASFSQLSGGASWTNLSNATGEADGNFSNYTSGGADSTSVRAANYSAIASEIPDGATIDGVQFMYRAQGIGFVEDLARVRYSGTTGGDDNASNASLPATSTDILIPATGGETETWNHPVGIMSKTALVDTGLAIDITFTCSGLALLGIDAVYMRAHFTEASATTGRGAPDAPWLVYGVHPRGVWNNTQ